MSKTSAACACIGLLALFMGMCRGRGPEREASKDRASRVPREDIIKCPQLPPGQDRVEITYRCTPLLSRRGGPLVYLDWEPIGRTNEAVLHVPSAERWPRVVPKWAQARRAGVLPRMLSSLPKPVGGVSSCASIEFVCALSRPDKLVDWLRLARFSAVEAVSQPRRSASHQSAARTITAWKRFSDFPRDRSLQSDEDLLVAGPESGAPAKTGGNRSRCSSGRSNRTSSGLSNYRVIRARVKASTIARFIVTVLLGPARLMAPRLGGWTDPGGEVPAATFAIALVAVLATPVHPIFGRRWAGAVTIVGLLCWVFCELLVAGESV